MTAKEYLSQAYRIDQRIDSQIEQITVLRDLLTKTGAVMSDMPKNPNKGESKMENYLIKIIDMENMITAEIDRLVTIKKSIVETIDGVADIDCRLLLEARYLRFETWEDIASSLGYTVRSIHRLHGKALSMVKVPTK